MTSREASSDATPLIGLFIPTLSDGGAERVVVNLARGLHERPEVDVELIVVRAVGPRLAEVPGDLPLVELGGARTSLALPALVRHLRRNRHAALVSSLPPANAVATAACRLARTGTRSVVTQHTNVTHDPPPPLPIGHLIAKHAYPRADLVVAVSDGVGEDLVTHGTPRARLVTIYNPVVTPELRALSQLPVEHPWLLDGGGPVIVSVGRLASSKDHRTLLQAMRLVNEERPVRLVILGEGPERAPLEALRGQLGLDEVVDLPGFVANPYPIMRAAQLVVSASRREGLPTVLIEAMYCGTPVVSTDCPSGPREVLHDGDFGSLVPMSDSRALADAINAGLDRPVPAPAQSWAPFTTKRAVDRYLELVLS